MYNISKACIDALNQPSRQMTARATITVSHGETISLSASDFKQGGIKLSEATSGSGGLELGAAVISKLTLTLNNSDGRFNSVNFIGGQVSSVQIGVTLPDNSREWIPLGAFDIDSVKYSGTAAEIVAYDNLSRADRELPAVTCPVTLGNLVRTVCTYCGIIWSGQRFLNDDYVVNALPDNATCRDVISYAAAIAGCYVKMNRDGRLTFGWYGDNTPRWESETWLDGGNFLDMTSGDLLDGGDFFEYSNDDDIDGGWDNFRGFCVLSNPKSIAGDKPITVTGIIFRSPDRQQSVIDGNGNEIVETVKGNTIISGTDEYAFDLSDNRLLTHDAPVVLSAIGDKIIGEKFHPARITCPSNPAFEAGDIVKVTDRRGNDYFVYVNRCEYKFGSVQGLSCEAETLGQNSADHNNWVSRLEQKLKSDTDKKISAYGSRLQTMNNLILNSMGVYKTAVKNADGSVTNYTHDKPTLETSSYISCETSRGFAYTNSGWNDGSPVWRYGMTGDGNIICNILSAVGIVADWIQAGRIESADGSCYFDLDQGQLRASKLGSDSHYLEIGITPRDLISLSLIENSQEETRKYFNVCETVYDNKVFAGFGIYDADDKCVFGASVAGSTEVNAKETFYVHVDNKEAFIIDKNFIHLLSPANSNKSIIEAGADHVYLRNPGSKNYWIALDNNGIGLNNSNKSIIEAVADHVYLRNPGSKDYWIALDNNGIGLNNSNKSIIEAGADHVYLQNPGSKDYWIALDNNGISICKGNTILQQWT